MKSNWQTKKLDDLCNVEYGTRVVNKRDGGAVFFVYGGGGATFKMNSFNREDRMVLARFAMSEACVRYVQGKFFLNDSGLTISPKDAQEVSQAFLDKWLIANNDLFYSLARGSAQKNLDVPAFRKIAIPFPPLPEQHRIVKILDDVFAATEKAKENAEKNLENSRQLYEVQVQKIFNDPDPGWVISGLGDICDIQNGFAFKSKDYSDSGYRTIRITNVQNGRIVDNRPKFLPEKIAEELSKFILQPEDILISLTGDVGRVGKIDKGLLPALLNQRVGRFCNISSEIDREYLYVFLNTKQFEKEVIESSEGAAQKNTSTKKIKDIQIAYPRAIADQHQIFITIQNLSIQTKKLEEVYRQKLALLEELKKSVLQKAFAGEL